MGRFESLKALEGRIGWMDSIDFDHELGNAIGGNKIYPDREDCEQNNSCIGLETQNGVSCYAKRVIVFDADKYEEAMGIEPEDGDTAVA